MPDFTCPHCKATQRAILKASRAAAKRAWLKSCARCVWNARCVGNFCSWAGSRKGKHDG